MTTTTRSPVPAPSSRHESIPERFYEILQDVWGFANLRPSQEAAIASILEGRDTLVIMPTGGGKSLCYQAPALLRGGMTIVVSPLIALMKDQVDSLKQVGVNAVRVDSTLSLPEKRQVVDELKSGNVRLLFVSPERIASQDFIRLLDGNQVHTIAIDEAHCVSQWGHDFRPEYRQLSSLRNSFPGAAMHAFTATATVKVRADIMDQLQLKQPRLLISSFDRPNLTYRVLPQVDLQDQIREVCERHRGSGGIVYCLRRNDVEVITAYLQGKGFSAVGYHAGMSHEERKNAQEAFITESVDVAVATVAFGMGIDRSNVRFVVHASIPKSIEHYQQETGRAGRDGLPSECVLFHSVGDVMTLKKITESSLREANATEEIIASSRLQIEEISRYCQTPVCRHRALVQYFGQSYDLDSCGACDVCLGDTDEVPDAKVIAQKILSCVYRVQERFGVNHVVDVLLGARTQNVIQRGHDQVSTYGILKEVGKAQLRDWVYQLVGQGALTMDGSEYPILKLNAVSKTILFGDAQPRLIRTATKTKERKQASTSEASIHADSGLFEKLKLLRRKLAQEQNVPPFVIFADNTLIEMSASRPSSLEKMLQISGVGKTKLNTYGQDFLDEIVGYCSTNSVGMDAEWKSQVTQEGGAKPNSNARLGRSGTGTKTITIPLLREGKSFEEIAATAGITPGTVASHLLELMETEALATIDHWVPEQTQRKIIAAANEVGRERLKPIYDHLLQEIEYESIRLVLNFEKQNA